LVTNLPATRYRLDMIYRAYKWRWQVEIYQSCNLRRTLFWHNIDFFSLSTAQRAAHT
jgi:hypothetical protein